LDAIAVVKAMEYASELSSFPAEDRTFGGNELFVDLIPKSCWFTNVRCCVDPADWDRIRTLVYRRAEHRCEICGCDPYELRMRLEAHERWAYFDENATQYLRRLIALCSACHESTHFGLARLRGRDKIALTHLMTVNAWNHEQALAHVASAAALWVKRNKIAWKLDISLITDVGIQPVRRSEFHERKKISGNGLRMQTPAWRKYSW
jgi:hypothetical protein